MVNYKIFLPLKYNVEIADINKRIISYLIDLIIFVFFFSLPYLTMLFYNLNIPLDKIDINLLNTKYSYILMIYSFTNSLIFLFYLTISEYILNFTFGKKLMNIKVISLNRKKLTFNQVFFRNLTKSIFLQLLLFDIFPIYFDNKKRRISDFILKTLVVTNKKTIKKFKEVIEV